MLKIRGLIFIAILSLPMVSSGYQCPDSTNLKDASARGKCLYKIISHWKEVTERYLIKDWQRARAGKVLGPTDFYPGGLNDTTHYHVSKFANRYIKQIIEYNKILDRLEGKGVYQLPYRIPQPPSE